MPKFLHKTVVITGACAGIGRALALRFGEAGARIALVDIRDEELAAFSEHLESRSVYSKGYHCDTSVREQVKHCFQSIREDFGKIDVLINNAGITHHSAFEETDPDVFQKIMDVNYFGALNCTRSALQSLIENQGQVITMSSMAGFAPLEFRSAYSASKHALHGLFDCLRVELRNKNVNVMLACPGFTATDIYKHALRADGSISSQLQMTGKASAPADVAEEIYQAALKRKRLLILSNVDWRARLFARCVPGFFEKHLAHRISGIARPSE
ncbi:SDR family oxidoreductase [Sansalvadorimonas sp. 2012CJ34-2]|uniref:SDR family oxidoreductase n=1 Tax=Parendozoicomonas callyspongiae TaxID=2942213 RepID=A0ABT0PCJ3_9GAMM|nr:SDR family oxidoreductase [Sansalvadorimonas sp. 2012CJ34-2]MCL6269102.1 SDR family oxidoreductase [Sansalvadorimonas sp. 2012CJ34-2]